MDLNILTKIGLRLKANTPVADRLEYWSCPDPNSGCWLWLGMVDAKGYGLITVRQRKFRAHRLAYTEWAGPIPDSMVIDHKCRNPSCINPSHLEVVTSRENTLRGLVGSWHRVKTHCPHGHPYSGDNVSYGTGKFPGQTRRNCKTCKREAARRARLQVVSPQ